MDDGDPDFDDDSARGHVQLHSSPPAEGQMSRAQSPTCPIQAHRDREVQVTFVADCLLVFKAFL